MQDLEIEEVEDIDLGVRESQSGAPGREEELLRERKISLMISAGFAVVHNAIMGLLHHNSSNIDLFESFIVTTLIQISSLMQGYKSDCIKMQPT